MTQIIATIGPNKTEDAIKQMIDAGMNVARLNFAHGNFHDHKINIEKIRKAAKSIGRFIPIMVDLPGPKIRLEEVDGIIELKVDQTYILTTDNVVGDDKRSNISIDITEKAAKGDIIYLNDGFVKLEVNKIKNKDILCTVIIGGNISSRKGVNVTESSFSGEAFTEYDKECLDFCAAMDVEMVCQSFVKSEKSIQKIKKRNKELGYSPIVIAKIERESAVDNVDSILEVVDGIMVARGDLAIQKPLSEIALLQKILARKAKEHHKSVIVATQMMESMLHSARPTRAESADICNAVLDGADFTMLSEETAIGKFPIEAISFMKEIITSTEYFVIRGLV